ncbi:alkaline phosphatase family protein [Nocardioides sp.]|uniref:alkaline phosphatase family protein n=1 Tax=Nocardioides sp. TaxID=35761 RepID=UPI003528E985
MPDLRSPARPVPARPPARRARLRAAAALVTVAALTAGGVAWLGRTTEPERPSSRPPAIEPAASQASFRVGSFNVLGASHTDPGGDRRGKYAGYQKRLRLAVRAIREEKLQVVGLQEFQAKQADYFDQIAGSEFRVYPGTSLGRRASVHNSIIWRRDTWKLLESHTIRIPYFKGDEIQMPYVLLQSKLTGQKAWFYNSHNPANTHGDAWKWRKEGYRREAELVAGLRAADPTVPVVVTGDKNERERYFCYITPISELHSASGGTHDGTCHPPAMPQPVDWVMGSSDVRWTGYTDRRDWVVSKATDHPLVFADAQVAPRQPPYADRVVVVDVEGLTAGSIRRLGATGAPTLHRLMAEGASTLNARTLAERTTRDANVVGMLTGRRVTPDKGGHGVDWDSTWDRTVHAAAGHYVSSVFDLVHNYAYRTSLVTRDNLTLVDRSWDAANGGRDPYGVDNGRDKIADYVGDRNDARAMSDLLGRLGGAKPPTLSFLHLSAPSRTGVRTGFTSAEYDQAVTQADARLGQLLSAIEGSSALAGRTLVVVTSDHGGSKTLATNTKALPNIRVPFLAWGPGVAVGADLYALNPQLKDPGGEWKGYGGRQPVRTAHVAAVVTKALGLPPVPGGTLDPGRTFTVFAPSQ